MKRVPLLALALAMCASMPAAGWGGDSWETDPEFNNPESPAAPAAATTEPTGSSEPSATAPGAPSSDPPLPPGFGYVTDVVTGGTVTQTPEGTTYRSESVHQTPGTISTRIEFVATGQPSKYDRILLNGRPTLSNGQGVGGEIRLTLVNRGGIWEAVGFSIIYDETELLRKAQSARPAETSPVRSGPIIDGGERSSLPAEIRMPAPSRDDFDRELLLPPPLNIVLPPPPFAVAPVPATVTPPAPPAVPPRIVVGVDPTNGPALLTSFEVARGQRFALRVNALADGRPVAVTSWTFVEGRNDAANPGGWVDGGVPLGGQWLRLPPPGQPWTLTLRVRVRLADGTSAESDGRVEIWVRAPAIVE